jgi:hypothetical protein
VLRYRPYRRLRMDDPARRSSSPAAAAEHLHNAPSGAQYPVASWAPPSENQGPFNCFPSQEKAETAVTLIYVEPATSSHMNPERSPPFRYLALTSPSSSPAERPDSPVCC